MLVAMVVGREIAKDLGPGPQMSTTLDVVLVGDGVVEDSNPRTLTFARTCTPAASKTSTIGAWPRTFCILCTNKDFNLLTCPPTSGTKSIISPSTVKGLHKSFHSPRPEYKFTAQLFEVPRFKTVDHLRGSFPDSDPQVGPSPIALEAATSSTPLPWSFGLHFAGFI